MHLELWQWALGALGAFLVGLSKTGIPGLGILNVAIFENLHFASVAVIDLTGERPNCFTELGYALGCRGLGERRGVLAQGVKNVGVGILGRNHFFGIYYYKVIQKTFVWLKNSFVFNSAKMSYFCVQKP